MSIPVKGNEGGYQKEHKLVEFLQIRCESQESDIMFKFAFGIPQRAAGQAVDTHAGRASDLHNRWDFYYSYNATDLIGQVNEKLTGAFGGGLLALSGTTVR